MSYLREGSFASPRTDKKRKGLITETAADVHGVRNLTDDWIVDREDRLFEEGLTSDTIQRVIRL